jgi:eukaryotic-like serine/threonine-protein kinase
MSVAVPELIHLDYDQPVVPECDTGVYELGLEIARGGMGVVYQARHRDLGRTVAMKIMRGAGFANAEEIGRFRGETEAAARLDHPNIVPIYEVGEIFGQPFFTMKLIEGGNLGQRLKSEIIPCVRRCS